MQLRSVSHDTPAPMPAHRAMHAEDFLDLLAKAIAICTQAQLGEPPVFFEDWPSDQQAKCLYAARVASRWNDLRARRDAELHCRQRLALVRYSTPYAELAPRQQRAINTELYAVLTIFAERLSDREFVYLSHDQRAVLEPERHASSVRGVQ